MTDRPEPAYNGIAVRPNGGWCRVRVDPLTRCILAASSVRCVWTGTPKFDRWFRRQYPGVEVMMLPAGVEIAL